MAEPAILAVPSSLRVERLGLTPYLSTWNYQKQLQQKLIEGSGAEVLLLCEHRPVITLGRGAREDNLLVEPQSLAKLGVELFHTERGGDATYHGPGQLVAYPILDLKTKRRDVAWYMRSLEEAVIRTMASYGVQGVRVPGRTGVWVEQMGYLKKISSLGVRISRWCTMHGISLNVFNCRHGFSLINPCGFADIDVASLEECGATVDMYGVFELFTGHFLDVFGFDFGVKACEKR